MPHFCPLLISGQLSGSRDALHLLVRARHPELNGSPPAGCTRAIQLAFEVQLLVLLGVGLRELRPTEVVMPEFRHPLNLIEGPDAEGSEFILSPEHSKYPEWL